MATPLERRQFLAMLSGLAAALLPVTSSSASLEGRFTAIIFDAFPIFDTGPVATLAEMLFPGRGSALTNTWRTRQFEYAWLRSLSHRYADFMHVTDDALVFSARANGLELTPDKRRQLLNVYSSLSTWPDVIPALKVLKDRYRLAILSNFSPSMLNGCIRAGRLEGVFDHVLSTDIALTYKPDPRAYQLGIDALRRPREEILFVAFAGWDAAGAKAFGYPTFWVNRQGLPPEELDVETDGFGADLADLLAFLKAREIRSDGATHLEEVQGRDHTAIQE